MTSSSRSLVSRVRPIEDRYRSALCDRRSGLAVAPFAAPALRRNPYSSTANGRKRPLSNRLQFRVQVGDQRTGWSRNSPDFLRSGRTSSAKLVTVFGGSGFIGRYVVQALAKRGHRIRVAVRRPDLAGHVQPLGMVGQIKPIQANLRYRWSVDRAVEGADAVVNLVGILAEGGRQTFDAVQAFGPRAIGEAARAAGISNVVHVSAIGADQPSTIGYLRSKAEGEAGISEAVPDAVIMRPSIVFGPGDGFLQPLRGDGADLAGPAADRRGQRRASSRSTPATSARRSRAPSTAMRSAARSTSSAGRRC